MSHRDQPHFVYRLLGKRGRVVYVGCTMNVSRRLAEHRRSGGIGEAFARVEVEGPYSFDEARARERELIEQRPGAFNVEWTDRHRRGLSVPQLARGGTA
jgi:predicted GIY-YIG superfamily endonuclease